MSDFSAPIPSSSLSVPQTPIEWESVERFIGQISHDLRNGLNACELQLTFLAEISSDPEATAEIKQLRQTLAGMTKQLQALRSAVGSAAVHPMDYPANDLFEDLRERFTRLHPDKAAKVDWQISVAVGQTVFVDPEITLSACLELLLNASQFGSRDLEIACSMRQTGTQVACSVEQMINEAPSLSPNDWGKTPLVSTRRGAYGLGLFRARRVLAAQGSGLAFTYATDSKRIRGVISLPTKSA